MKWDAFIGRKGGLKNNLAPLKTTTQANEPLNLDFNQKPKLDAIPAGKHDEKRSPSPVQRSPSPVQRPPSPPAERPQSPPAERQQSPSTERPQSPTPEQQQQRQTEDQQRVDKEENQVKESLKGKPIIFVGGGPGTYEQII